LYDGIVPIPTFVDDKFVDVTNADVMFDEDKFDDAMSVDVMFDDDMLDDVIFDEVKFDDVMIDDIVFDAVIFDDVKLLHVALLFTKTFCMFDRDERLKFAIPLLVL
jgi:hypothetical protein